MTGTQHVTTNRAVSTRAPDQVRVDERDDLVFTVTTPEVTEGGSASSEQLYAAALASCLHQAVAVEATKFGVSTTDSRVHASATLTHDGNQRFGLQAEVSIELPQTDTDTAARIKSEALATCPPINGVEISHQQ